MAFWDSFFKKKSDSASHAVDRIKFVLQSDRTGLPPETLERIKNDIISVLSKYVDIATDELDFNITKAPSEDGQLTPALCANIPIKGVKHNRGNAGENSAKENADKEKADKEKTDKEKADAEKNNSGKKTSGNVKEAK